MADINNNEEPSKSNQEHLKEASVKLQNNNKHTLEEIRLQVEETERIGLETVQLLQVATMLHRSSGRSLFQKLLPCIYKK